MWGRREFALWFTQDPLGSHDRIIDVCTVCTRQVNWAGEDFTWGGRGALGAPPKFRGEGGV